MLLKKLRMSDKIGESSIEPTETTLLLYCSGKDAPIGPGTIRPYFGINQEKPMKQPASHNSSHPGDGLIDAPLRVDEFNKFKRKEAIAGPIAGKDKKLRAKLASPR
jgi:hypothetical protein